MSYLPKIGPSVTRGLGGLPKPSKSLEYNAGEVHISEYPKDNTWIDADGSIVLQSDYPELYEAIGLQNLYTPMGTLLANPVDPPTQINTLAWDGTGVYLGVGANTLERLRFYKRSGDVLTNLGPGSPAFINSNVKAIAWTDDGVYCSVAHGVSPWFLTYKRTGDTLNALPNPAVPPGGTGLDEDAMQYSGGESTYLAMAAFSQGLLIYKRLGDVLERLTGPATNIGYATEVSITYDGVYIATASAFDVDLFIYKRSGDFFSEPIFPSGEPGAAADMRGIAFSPEGDHLAAVYNTNADVSNPRVRIYKRTGDTFAALPDPTFQPTSDPQGVVWSGRHLIVITGSALTTYKRSGDFFEKVETAISDITNPFDFAVTNTTPDGVYIAGHGPVSSNLNVWKSAEAYNPDTQFEVPLITTDLPARIKSI